MATIRALVTGGAGFIGSHFLHVMLQRHPGWNWHVLDGLRYSSSLDRLADLRGRITLHWHDLRARIPDHLRQQLRSVDYVFHFAAETHVDRSLVEPAPFVEANIMGTFHVLEYLRTGYQEPKMLFYISTDEVYGPAEIGQDHTEDAPHRPSNPYSASKAAAEDLCYAWNRSMDVPVIVTNTMNNVGETQHPEKFLPKILRALRGGGEIKVHGSPDEPGMRKYLYAGDHADALDFLLREGRRGEKYNVVGAEEVTNIEMVQRLEKITGAKARMRFVDFHSTRPGHDLRYSLDGSKMAALGWTPPTPLDDALRRMVRWYEENPEWLAA